MTRIRLTNRANIAGGHHEVDDVVSVDAEVAANMVALGRAVLVDQVERVAQVETAVRAAPQTAARTTARSRVRSGRETRPSSA